MQKIPHATPETAYQLYRLDVISHGQRGAYARVGRQLGRSDETVRRWVHQCELSTSDVDPLKYQPPPFGYPPPVPREMPQTATDDATDAPQNATEPAAPVACVPENMPQDATPERRAVIRRPMPQRHEVRWWRTVNVHPQVWAIIGAVVLIIIAFPK